MTQAGMSRWRLMLRWLVAACLLLLVGWTLDGRLVWQELKHIAPVVWLPALALTVLQVLLSAWRWRYTVRQLGVVLPYGYAVREYYLATFLNQVLPGGVLGDVNRAWRQGRGPGDRLTALHGVAIERLSGQLTLALVVVISMFWLLQSGRLALGAAEGGFWWLGAAVVCVTVLVAALKRGAAAYLQRLRRDLFRALLDWPVLPVQLGSSLLVLASYLAVFLCLAWGGDYLASWETALLVTALASLLLLSMVLPVTVAGWGVREASAAVIWPLAGLPAEQGVALSVGYGAVVLVSSLPGLAGVFTVSTEIRQSPDRTACHCPD